MDDRSSDNASSCEKLSPCLAACANVSEGNSRNQIAFSFIILTKREKEKRILFIYYDCPVKLIITFQISDFAIIEVICNVQFEVQRW